MFETKVIDIQKESGQCTAEGCREERLFDSEYCWGHLSEGQRDSYACKIEKKIKAGMSLRRANLSRTNLSIANLFGADLSRANLSNTNLSRANLSNTNLSGANLSGAYLSEAKLSEATIIGGTRSILLTDVLPSLVRMSYKELRDIMQTTNPGEKEPHPLEHEMAWFEEHKGELLRKYAGKYVAIKGEEVVCVKDTEEQIIDEVYGKGIKIKGKFVEGSKVGGVFIEKVSKERVKRYIFNVR